MTDTIHHYSAEAAPKGMRRHVGQMFGYPAVVWHNRGLVWNFFKRELLGRFRGSLLGLLWVLIQPMFLFALYFFLFGVLFAHPRAGQAGPDVTFALYLFSGILTFSAFSEPTGRGCGVVVENGNLVKKVAFPCELLPVHHLLVSTIVYLVGMLVVIAVGVPTGAVKPGLAILAWPLVIVVQTCFALGVALGLAALLVFVRDTGHLYTIFSQAWFFLSPVFWDYRLLESKFTGDFAGWDQVFRWNPMYPILMANRQVLGLRYEGMAGVGSLGSHLAQGAAWALVALLLGYSFFMSRKHKFADLV